MSGEPIRTGTKSRVTVIPTGKALGAEIQGVDLRTIDADDFASIHQAWLDHSVLLFRGQKLTDDDLIAFSRKFGDLDWAPIQETGRRFVEGHPEIYVVSNVMENGVPIGSLGAGEATWHTDMSYLAGSSEGEHALCAGSSAIRRQHVFQQHVWRLRNLARCHEETNRRQRG